MLLIDVMCLAGLYSLRLLAGKAAASIQISFGLMAFSLFFFLSLALLKRYVELQSTTAEDGTVSLGVGIGLKILGIISQSGVASGFIAVLVLALYIQSKEISALYAQTHDDLAYRSGRSVYRDADMDSRPSQRSP